MAVKITEDDNFPDRSSVIASGKSFEEFGDSLPEDATGGFAFLADPEPAPTPGGTILDAPTPGEEPRKRKVIQMSKKMKKAVDGFKDKVAAFPTVYFASLAAQDPAWALSEEEGEIIKDSISLAFEMLDIEFAFEPLSIQLTSIWWIIAYPFLAFGFIFYSKKSLVTAKHKDDPQP